MTTARSISYSAASELQPDQVRRHILQISSGLLTNSSSSSALIRTDFSRHPTARAGRPIFARSHRAYRGLRQLAGGGELRWAFVQSTNRILASWYAISN
jgi:hypothetical protein